MIKRGDFPKCELLLKHGARICSGLLALDSYNGYNDIVVVLVKNGANVNELDDNIGTPLEGSSLNGNTDVYDF